MCTYILQIHVLVLQLAFSQNVLHWRLYIFSLFLCFAICKKSRIVVYTQLRFSVTCIYSLSAWYPPSEHINMNRNRNYFPNKHFHTVIIFGYIVCNQCKWDNPAYMHVWGWLRLVMILCTMVFFVTGMYDL